MAQQLHNSGGEFGVGCSTHSTGNGTSTIPQRIKEPECSRLNTEGKEDVVIAHTRGVITILPSS